MHTPSVSKSSHHRHHARRRAPWRPTALAACTLGLLVACGGGGGGGGSAPATYSIGGNVTGLGAGNTLVLTNNGADDLSVAANGAFTFATPIHGAYSVAVKTQPPGQACTVAKGSGTAAAAVSSVAVNCYVVYTTATSSVLAGTGTYGYVNNANPLQAQFKGISGLTGDGAGNLYVADSGSNAVRYVGSNGPLGTYAGAVPPGAYDYLDNPNPLVARFNGPARLVRADNGTLYVADYKNHCIRKIASGANATTAGAVTTVAGTCGTQGFTNGAASTARFYVPHGLALDEAQQVLYVADSGNNSIRKIKLGSLTAADAVSTLAGDGTIGSADGQGSTARFNHPMGLARDAQGNLIVADFDNQTIRKIDANGQVSTLAGMPRQFGYANGAGNAAKFYGPTDVVADANGCMYVADQLNHVIRMLRPAGGGGYTVSTLAGAQPTNGTDPAPSGTGTGSGAATQFNRVYALWLDGKGTLYSGVEFGYRILRLTLQP